MAVSAEDQRLLSTFPLPPSGLPTLAPAKFAVRTPTTPHHPSDFGFIQAGRFRDYDNDSLCDDPLDYEKATPNPHLDRFSFSPTELQLHLDSPSKLYSPRETVTGYISGWDYSTSNPTHVHVILEGRVHSALRRDHTERRNISPLLYQVTHLEPHAQRVAPRFAITIPEHTSSHLTWDHGIFDRYWTHEWPGRDPYECQAGHPLPPSMNMSPRSSITLTSCASGYGYVEYKLIAVRSTLNPATGQLIPEASCQIPLCLTTRRLAPIKIQELASQCSTASAKLAVQTAQLTKDRRLSLREQLRDTFNSSSPTFYFASTVTTPRLSLPGEDITISLSASVLAPPLGQLYNFPIPDLEITSLKFRIRSYTGIRTLYTSRNATEKLPRTKSHTFKSCDLRTSKSLLGKSFKPKGGNFDKQTCVITLKLPGTLVPSFKTYNCWRSYRLECDVTFTVAGKDVTSHTQTDLNIVARPAGTMETQRERTKSDFEREDEATSLDMAQAMVRLHGLVWP